MENSSRIFMDQISFRGTIPDDWQERTADFHELGPLSVEPLDKWPGWMKEYGPSVISRMVERLNLRMDAKLFEETFYNSPIFHHGVHHFAEARQATTRSAEMFFDPGAVIFRNL